MRKRKTSVTALEREYFSAPEPKWTGALGRCSARVCMECGIIAAREDRTCPGCGAWDMARLTRQRSA